VEANSGRKYLSEEKKMTTSTSNRQTAIIDDLLYEAGLTRGIRTLVVQDYPSLVGTDDELLPSGD
jgi:hypothetical protein